MKDAFVVKGHLCYSVVPESIKVIEHGFLVCEDGRIVGAFDCLPERYAGLPLYDFGERLVIPGLTDLHVHAPQYTFRSLGMDMELMDWLNTHTFPEEAKYTDLDYADRAYDIFVNDLKMSATCRASVFATLHVPAARLLMDKLEASGVKTYVGKVNMDRNCPDILCEESAAQSVADTKQWLEDTIHAYKNVRPILTPRFTPACSDELLEQIGKLQRDLGLPVQSHLSENPGEVAFVAELCPDCDFYGQSYDRYGLFGSNGPAIMAHCVYSGPEEIALMKERGVFIAHCPQSNMNLSSGIAPARKYMEMGLNMGLGTDIAGGYSLSIFRAMADAAGVSKLYWRLVDEQAHPLSTAECFYLGTKGGGAFFGQCGSFEAGYAADIVVLDDEQLPYPSAQTDGAAWPYSLEPLKRLERMIYLGDNIRPFAKFVEGVRIF